MSYLKDFLLALLLVLVAYLIALLLPLAEAHSDGIARHPYVEIQGLGWIVLDEKTACPAPEWDRVPQMLRDGTWRMGSLFALKEQRSVPLCWDLGFVSGQLVALVKFHGETEVVPIPLEAFKFREGFPVKQPKKGD
jgi:hypothetical protein